MTTQCHEALALAYPYLDRELTWYSRWKVKRHLSKCDNCCSKFDFEVTLKKVVREKSQEDVPPEVLDRLRQFLNEASSS